jgi:sec-independent protein translocase protein TatB
MMKRMSFSETVFLFFLALIIFGPKKLPEIARQVGKYMNEFKRASNEFKAQIEQEIAHLEVEKPSILPPSRAPEGATSRSLNPAPSVASSTASPAPAAPSTIEPSEDEPLFAIKAATAEAAATESVNSTPATEAAPHSEDVTSSSSQESHV